MNHKKIFLVIIILTVPYLLLIGNFYFYLYNESFYHKEFEKNNIQINNDKDILKNTLNYFKDKEKLIYYSEKGKQHLSDVKDLIKKIIFLFYFFFVLDIILLIILINKKNIRLILKKLLLHSGILTLSICILFFLLSFNFDFLFTNFHNMFFEEGTWQFYKDSLIINMFPFFLFKDFFFRIIVNTVIGGVVLVVLGYCMFRNKK